MIDVRYATRGLKLVLLLTLGLIAFVSFAFNPVQAAPQYARVVFNPATFTLPPGNETITVAIRVENVEDLYGLELAVLFDPTVVTVESIEPGDFLSADFVVPSSGVDNETGRAFLAYTQLSPAPARSGSGDVAILTLRRAARSGQPSLQLADVVLSDNNGMVIPHTVPADPIFLPMLSSQ